MKEIRKERAELVRPMLKTMKKKKNNYSKTSTRHRWLDTDGSFTWDDSSSVLSPYDILLIAQEDKYFGKFSYIIMKFYAVCSH